MDGWVRTRTPTCLRPRVANHTFAPRDQIGDTTVGTRETFEMSAALEVLLELGDPGGRGKWLDYLALGLGSEAEEDLIAVLGDPAFVWAEMHSNESWAALHAWRSLGQLKSVKAIPSLVGLMENVEDDDWMMQDLPEVFGMIGTDALPALSEYVADAGRGTFPRAIASSALLRIAQLHPEARDECVRAQMAALEGFEQQDPLLNSMVAGDLVELDGIEAASLIGRAFRAEQMDVRHMGDWEDVQIALGLLSQRITPRPRLNWFGDAMESADARADQARRRRTERQTETKKKARSKQKRKAARRSRRRNRH